MDPLALQRRIEEAKAAAQRALAAAQASQPQPPPQPAPAAAYHHHHHPPQHAPMYQQQPVRAASPSLPPPVPLQGPPPASPFPAAGAAPPLAYHHPPPVQVPTPGPPPFPTPPPEDQAAAERMQKMAAYVHRNGADFERMMMAKEQANPRFQFLFDGREGSAYYRWVLHTLRAGMAPEVAAREVRLAQAHRQLLPQEEGAWEEILSTLVGSREAVQRAREWVVSHKHGTVHALKMMRRHAHRMAAAASQQPPPTQPSASDPPAKASYFPRALAFLYVLNDCYFAFDDTLAITDEGSGAPTAGLSKQDFRDLALPQVAYIVHFTRVLAASEADADRVVKIVQLWGEKGVYAEAFMGPLHSAAQGHPPNDGRPPPSPPLVPAPVLHPSRAGTPTLPYMQPLPPQPQPAPAFPYAGGAVAAAAAAAGMALPPVAAGPAGAALQAAGGDLGKVPVGAMVAIVRAVLTAGHGKPYRPIDLKLLPPNLPYPRVEPGRIEVRLKDFYRKLDARHGVEKPVEEEGAGEGQDEAAAAERRRQEAYPVGKGERSHAAAADHYDSSAAAAAGSAVAARPADAPLDDSNLGVAMLKGMGWTEGRGLGAAGTGIAEPIAAGGSSDKAGVGLADDDGSGYVRPKSRTIGGEEVEDLFEYWRRQKSSAYHAKIEEEKLHGPRMR